MPPAPPPPPQAAIGEDERAEILRRHAAGESRNSIARAVGRAPSTVSKVVAAAGGTFVRAPEVAAATKAQVIDLAARRAQLALDLQADAERLRQQLWEPHTYFDWGGKEHDFDTHTTSEPTPADKRSILSAVATAVDRSLKLEPVKDDPANEARSMVGQLMAGLAQVYREQEASEGAGDAP